MMEFFDGWRSPGMTTRRSRVPKDETPTITVFFAKGAASSIEIPMKEIP